MPIDVLMVLIVGRLLRKVGFPMTSVVARTQRMEEFIL